MGKNAILKEHSELLKHSEDISEPLPTTGTNMIPRLHGQKYMTEEEKKTKNKKTKHQL